jgi:mono/diheme cytochrome c family protein
VPNWALSRLAPVRRLAPILLVAAFFVAGCGGQGTSKPLPTKVIGTLPTSTTGTEQTVSGGNAAAGKKVFAAQGCGSCHADQAAGTNGNVGPNLTTGLKGKTPAFIQQSIVDPNADVTEGYQPNIMPQTYGDQLSKTQLADLVAFLSPQ